MSPSSIGDCVDMALTTLALDTQKRFAADPLSTMREDLGLSVTAVPRLSESRTDGGACDGTTYLSDGVVLYATTGNRRENFTLAHELGHWLIDQQHQIYNWLGNQDEPAKMLETVCDHIAQRLLLPQNIIGDLLNDGPLRAHHVTALHDRSRASLPVAAIALADQLPNMGAIAIIDRATGRVHTSSVHPDPDRGWPRVYPWPGDQLTDTDPLLRLPPQATTSTRRPWRTPWGATETFYMDAFAEHRRIVAVFSSTDLWNIDRFHPADTRTYDTRPTLTGNCCGAPFEQRGYPCPDCEQPYCPACGLCRCQTRAAQEQLCGGSCFMKYRPNLLVGGLCEDCRT